MSEGLSFKAEVDANVKALTSLIEPVMIVFVGIMVGFIVISMYLPFASNAIANALQIAPF